MVYCLALKLSRYVHLNPVKVAGVVSKPLVERLDILRNHSWSSYPSYTGPSPRNEFVDYEPILTVVESVSGVAREELLVQQRDCRWRTVAARVLCRYGGLTQRAAAKVLGMRTGVAASCQLRRLTELAAMDKALRRTIEKIEAELDQEQQRKGC
jgi:hypothetical protein